MSREITTNWLDAYLTFTEQTGQPELYRIWCAVSGIASALQRKTYLTWLRGQKLFPNFYIVLVGVPGGTKKSTSMASIREILNKTGGISISADATTKEALVRQVRASTVSEILDPVKMTQLMHSSITIHSSELAAFFHRKDDIGLTNWLCEWFDSPDSWTYETISRDKEAIEGLWINLIGATTPELLGLIFPQNVIGAGLTSRMIFVFSDRLKRQRVPEGRDDELFQKLVNDLELISLMKGEFYKTPAYDDTFWNWYVSEHAPAEIKEDPEFSYYLERRHAHLHKMAMVISASFSNDMVLLKDHFDLALNLLERTERLMPFAFSQYTQEENHILFNRVMAEIQYSGEEGITTGSLLATFFKEYPQTEIVRAIRTLHQMEPSPVKVTKLGEGRYHLLWIGEQPEEHRPNNGTGAELGRGIDVNGALTPRGEV